MAVESDRYHLPNEIWLEVINLATYVKNEGGVTEWTGSYDRLEMGRKFVTNTSFGWEMSTTPAWLDYKTRCSLTLVSKTWNQLSTPILYRFIYIEKISSLLHFTSLIREKPELRQFVNFLVFSFRHRSGNLNVYGQDVHIMRMSIHEIYRSCPNVAFVCDMGCGELLPLPIGDHPPSLQALDTGYGLLGLAYPLFDYLSHFRSIRFLILGIGAHESNRDKPKLTLPMLEILSIRMETGITRDMDEYLSEAELPKLHSLHLYLEGLEADNRLHPLDTIQSFCKILGHQFLTLMIEDRRDWFSTRNRRRTPSFNLDQYLPNLQQLLVNSWVNVSVLEEMSICDSIRILDICNPSSISFNPYIDAERTAGGITGGDTILNRSLIRKFKNLQSLRFSSSKPDLWGREYADEAVVNGLNAFLKKHRAEMEDWGIRIESRLIQKP